jgi:hypothetical protein
MDANEHELNAEPITGRGAALPAGRSIGCQQAAPGSRPSLTIVPDVRAISCKPVRSIRQAKHTRWVISGSRLLQTHRTAT